MFQRSYIYIKYIAQAWNLGITCHGSKKLILHVKIYQSALFDETAPKNHIKESQRHGP